MTSPYWSRVRLGNVDIGIHEGALPDGPGWEPGFRVHDIAAARASLVANGVEVTQEFHDIPGGVKLAFADPSGNVLGLLQYGIAVADLEA